MYMYHVCMCVIDVQTFWKDVREEMINVKGLNGETADKIGKYVQQSGKQTFHDISITQLRLSIIQCFFTNSIYTTDLVNPSTMSLSDY